jgi:hypothetical protein
MDVDIRPVNAINYDIPRLRFVSFQKDNGELCEVYKMGKRTNKFYIPDIEWNVSYYEKNYPSNYDRIVLEYTIPMECSDYIYTKIIEIRANSYDELDECTYFLTGSLTYSTNDTNLINNAIMDLLVELDCKYDTNIPVPVPDKAVNIYTNKTLLILLIFTVIIHMINL